MVLVLHFKTSSPNPWSPRFSHLLSSRSFLVLHLHLGVWSIGGSFFSMSIYMWMTSFSSSLMKRLFIFYWIPFVLCQINWLYLCMLFLGFRFFSNNLFVLLSVPCHRDNCSFSKSWSWVVSVLQLCCSSVLCWLFLLSDNTNDIRKRGFLFQIPLFLCFASILESDWLFCKLILYPVMLL